MDVTSLKNKQTNKSVIVYLGTIFNDQGREDETFLKQHMLTKALKQPSKSSLVFLILGCLTKLLDGSMECWE